MNKTILRIIIGIVVLLLIIVVVSFFIFRSGVTPVDSPTEQVPAGGLPQSGNIPGGQNNTEEPGLAGVPATSPDFAARVIAEDLEKRSVIAIERLGSYSSDRPLSNFNDILPQTTATLEVILRDAKAERESRFASQGSFEGYAVTAVTTNANIDDIINGRVVVTIGAVREVTIGAAPPENQNTTYSLIWDQGEDAIWRLSGISGAF